MVRISLSVFLLVSSISVFAVANLPHMTSTVLKNYDGKNGHKAYVALNGYVYDVSKVDEWKGGKHYKGMVAGTDLSPNIGLSPHGPDIVKELKLKPIAVYP
jgi:predicted heme/steroid binding protein